MGLAYVERAHDAFAEGRAWEMHESNVQHNVGNKE
jgi:hypothetical protein